MDKKWMVEVFKYQNTRQQVWTGIFYGLVFRFHEIIHCLIPCNPKNTPYCISNALIEAVKGNLENGLIFSGSNAYRLTELVSVKQLIKPLVRDAESTTV